jgi:hypothetical protein
MATENVFEEYTLTVFARLTEGQVNQLKDTKVTWNFTQTGGTSNLPAKVVDVAWDGATVSAPITFPKVKDDEDKYKLRYDITANTKRSTGKQDYVVWPRTYKVKAVRKNKDGAEEPCPGFKFRVSQDGVVDPADAELETDPNGVHDYVCKQKAPIVITAVSPWVIKSWKKKTGRNREVLVERKPYKAEITEPAGDAKPKKHYVNLLEDPAHADQGSLLTFKVGAKGDRARAPADKLGLKGDEIHVKVVFGDKNSARNDPKPRLIVGGADVAAEAGSNERIFKATVKLGDQGAPAEFKVELGFAGGDKCKV